MSIGVSSIGASSIGVVLVEANDGSYLPFGHNLGGVHEEYRAAVEKRKKRKELEAKRAQEVKPSVEIVKPSIKLKKSLTQKNQELAKLKQAKQDAEDLKFIKEFIDNRNQAIIDLYYLTNKIN